MIQRWKTKTLPPHIDPNTNANSCTPCSAVMWPYKSLRLVSRSHHRFTQVRRPSYANISARGAATPRSEAAEVLGECFAMVDQCTGAQT